MRAQHLQTPSRSVRVRRVVAKAIAAVSLVGSMAATVAVGEATPAAAAPATAITLTASRSSLPTGEYSTLTATPNGDLGDNYLDIFDQTTGWLVWSCTAEDPMPCTVDVTEWEAGTHSYISYVDNDPDPSNYPPSGISATSNPVAVNWYEPPPPPPAPRASDTYCPSPTLELLNGQILDIRDKLVVQMGSAQTAVCVRLEGAGIKFGGALVISTPGLGLPTTDSNVNACQSVLMNQVVAGLRFIVATGSAPGESWLCVQAGPEMLRVIIPTSGLPGVSWHPDDDSAVSELPPIDGGGGTGTECRSGRSAKLPPLEPICVQGSRWPLG